MKAFELADELDRCLDDGSTDLVCVKEAAEMLRQQEMEIKFTPPKKWLASEIDNNYRGIRWVAKDGVYGVPTKDDVINYLGYKDFIRDLSDEKIYEIADKFIERFEYEPCDVDEIGFARAIIKAMKGEE